MIPDLTTVDGRARLKARREPYWTRIVHGVVLGYRRGATAGIWHVRWRDPETGRKRYKSLGAADDDKQHGMNYEKARFQAIEFVSNIYSYAQRLDDTGVSQENMHGRQESRVKHLVDVTRSRKYSPPEVDMRALEKDLSQIAEMAARPARARHDVVESFSDFLNSLRNIADAWNHISTDRVRSELLLDAIALKRFGSRPKLGRNADQGLLELSIDYDLQNMSERLHAITNELIDLTNICLYLQANYLENCQENNSYHIVAYFLPKIFEKHFRRRFGRSTDAYGRRTGPGVRFVLAAAEYVGVVKPDGKPYSAETLHSAERKMRKRRGTG